MFNPSFALIVSKAMTLITPSKEPVKIKLVSSLYKNLITVILSLCSLIANKFLVPHSPLYNFQIIILLSAPPLII